MMLRCQCGHTEKVYEAAGKWWRLETDTEFFTEQQFSAGGTLLKRRCYKCPPVKIKDLRPDMSSGSKQPLAYHVKCSDCGNTSRVQQVKDKGFRTSDDWDFFGVKPGVCRSCVMNNLHAWLIKRLSDGTYLSDSKDGYYWGEAKFTAQWYPSEDYANTVMMLHGFGDGYEGVSYKEEKNANQQQKQG